MRGCVDHVVLGRSSLQRTVGFNAAFAINTSKGSRCDTTPVISCYSRSRCTESPSNLNRPLQTVWWIRAAGTTGASLPVIENRRGKVGTPGLYMTDGQQQQQQQQLVDRSQVRGSTRNTHTTTAVTAASQATTRLDVFERLAVYEHSGRWREAVDMVEGLRRQSGDEEPSRRVEAALVRLLLRSRQVLLAADVLEQAMARDENRRLPLEVILQVMKHLLGTKEHSRVIRLYRSLRIRRYIGLGSRASARMTTMATCYGAQASESLLSWRDAEDIYRLYVADRDAAGGGDGWGGLGESLPCVVFRTLYKAKRYEEALSYLENAITVKKYCNTILCNMAINCLGKTKRWAEAVSTFERMSTELGQAADGMTYSVVINALALSGRWKEAVALYDRMVKSPDRTTFLDNPTAMTSSLNSAINACDIAGRWQEALELLRRADDEGIAADMISFSTTMNALVRKGKCEAALEVFREMIKRKLEPGLVACNFVLTNCSKHKQGAVALAFLGLMKKAKLKITAVSYNAVITALHREDNPGGVLSTFREMMVYGLCPDTFAACHCLMACDKLDAHLEAAAVVRALWKSDGALNERLYNKAFSVLARGGHAKAIRGLLNDMEVRGEEPPEGCFTSLITACCKAERLEEAYELLFELKAEGKPIRTAAFTSVISSCKQVKNSDRALELFEEMKKGPPEAMAAPNQFTYNALIGVLTFSGCLDVAAEKFKEMQEAGFEYDQLTFVSMILGFARQGRHADVLVMFRGLETLTATSAQCNGVSGVWETRQKGYWACYNEALKACEAEGEWEMARRLVRSMRHQSMTLDVVTYGACIGACARAGRWQEALMTLREMEAMDKLAPNVVCYSSAITACEKSGEWRKALHLLLRMINTGVQPDTIAYNASISASAKCGEWQMALKLFDSLLRAELSPDARTYSAAILACFKGQQWQKAMELFGLMLRDRKLPDKYTINLLVELLDSQGQHDKAVYVYETVFRSRQAPESWDPSEGDVVDLHGYAAGVAKAAIRSGLKTLLRRFLTADKDPSVVRDFTFITGQGRHSRRQFEPVLRPAAEDMFLEEFDPPLESHFEPGNMGRLKVRKQDLVEWCMRQQSAGKKRAPAPADAIGSLKLRDVTDLQREFDKAVRAAEEGVVTASESTTAESSGI